MIPLGSRTMKLNAAAEMIPITAGIAELHPFCPPEQAEGSSDISASFDWLVKLTGYDAVRRSLTRRNRGIRGAAGTVTITKSRNEGHAISA
ncbi:hypothetical protein KCP77_06295 [Salmonella enterica subsp. enterica]|nr:hypothetical protein KCP77_06295 [Salmonella enterica subsp. enterica]